MTTTQSVPISALRFLIVEDDQFQQHWMSVMLTKLGAQHVVQAGSGRAALDLLRAGEQAFDILIIDLNLPEMDGIELLRHLSNDNREVAVILTSALGSALLFSVETLSHAYGVNLLGSFEKPATPELLQRLIAQYQRPHNAGMGGKPIPVLEVEEIREGIAAGQFEPYFQPKVEMSTGKVAALEVLVRWRHPQHGLLRPQAFLAPLEAAGHMDELTWDVIERAIAACRGWRYQGLTLPIAINLSPSVLNEERLADYIFALVSQYGLEPQDITFEVTELMATTGDPIYLENLARLRMKGFGLTVDGFGVKHSSMQQMLRIPFLDLKIDRAFVVGASKNTQLHIALSSCLDFARRLERSSVAVGVETREDWDLLRKLGCTHAQGYYIAKPMARDAVPAWVEEWSHFF